MSEHDALIVVWLVLAIVALTYEIHVAQRKEPRL